MNLKMIKFLAAGLSIPAAISTTYLIIPYEGAVKNKNGEHTVYLDAVGIPTACYGQTGKDHLGRTIQLGMKYSEEECLIMLTKTVSNFEKELDKLVKVNYVSDYEKAALLSFSYNLGINNVKTSTLIKKINNNDHIGACNELSKWVYAQKKILNGLVNRREDERQWCLGNVRYEIKVDIREAVEFVRSTTPVQKETKE